MAEKPPDDDESRAAAVLDAFFNDTIAVSQTSRVLLRRRSKRR